MGSDNEQIGAAGSTLESVGAGMAGELTTRRASPTDPSRATEPITGRVDAEAATIGSHGGTLGAVAAGFPPQNVGGAQGATPESAVGDFPGGDAGPEERAGILGSEDAAAGVATSGPALRGDLGGSIGSVGEASARTGGAGDAGTAGAAHTATSGGEESRS